MPAEKRDRISNFPSDGLFWWIRWVDHYRDASWPDGHAVGRRPVVTATAAPVRA